MAPRRTLSLGVEQRLTLEEMRDKHPKAYLRQRAAALLKIADGLSANWIAAHGLLKRVDVDWDSCVAQTLHDRSGLAGLYIRKGRGRNPFPPQPPSS